MPVIGVALAVPAPWSRQLQDFRLSLGDTEAAQIPTHITLIPPTGVTDEDVPMIEEHLGLVASQHPDFDIHLRGTGTFRPVSPVVFITLAQGIACCEQLTGRIRTGPLDVPLRFPYHPHVTIAQSLDDASLDRAFEEMAGFECRYRASAVRLYEHRDGSGWQQTGAFPLTGASR